MKSKLFIVLFCIMSMLLFSACGNGQSNTGSNQQNNASTQEGTKTLVVYFSATGNTKTLAENTAKVLHADLFEIQPQEPYTKEDLDYNDKNSRSTIEQNDVSARPKIANIIENFKQYNTIVIAYPIWWGQEPRIMDTFMESYDFSGKTIAAICTSGGSGIGSTDKSLAALASKSAQWKEGHLFSASTSSDELQDWFTKNGIIK